MVIKSDIFTEPEFVMSVKEDDWNDGPAASVAAYLTEMVMDGEIAFRPVEEKH